MIWSPERRSTQASGGPSVATLPSTTCNRAIDCFGRSGIVGAMGLTCSELQTQPGRCGRYNGAGKVRQGIRASKSDG
jgi:hypothetical protein